MSGIVVALDDLRGGIICKAELQKMVDRYRKSSFRILQKMLEEVMWKSKVKKLPEEWLSGRRRRSRGMTVWIVSNRR